MYVQEPPRGDGASSSVNFLLLLDGSVAPLKSHQVSAAAGRQAISAKSLLTKVSRREESSSGSRGGGDAPPPLAGKKKQSATVLYFCVNSSYFRMFCKS